MSARNGQLVCFLYNREQETIIIYLADSKHLAVSHRTMKIQRMKLPWVSFLTHTDLVTINKRLFSYYSNVLLLY
jgi:hypothetical protein